MFRVAMTMVKVVAMAAPYLLACTFARSVFQPVCSRSVVRASMSDVFVVVFFGLVKMMMALHPFWRPRVMSLVSCSYCCWVPVSSSVSVPSCAIIQSTVSAVVAIVDSSSSMVVSLSSVRSLSKGCVRH